jgi:hypothetical protein
MSTCAKDRPPAAFGADHCRLFRLRKPQRPRITRDREEGASPAADVRRFLKDGPEAEQIGGVCGPDDTRNLLNCDIYNGLPGYIITEVTLLVTWFPVEDDNARRFNVPITIKPLTTEHIVVRLGLQLPPDNVFTDPHGKVTAHKRWAWENVGAKGYPAK